jgi:hypothetical protein
MAGMEIIVHTSEEDIISVAQLIIEYLKNNPDAKDTVEGIAKWWVHKDKAVVERALDYLVKRKKVMRYDAQTQLYSRN